jgi:hypothetical protein
MGGRPAQSRGGMRLRQSLPPKVALCTYKVIPKRVFAARNELVQAETRNARCGKAVDDGACLQFRCAGRERREVWFVRAEAEERTYTFDSPNGSSGKHGWSSSIGK